MINIIEISRSVEEQTSNLPRKGNALIKTVPFKKNVRTHIRENNDLQTIVNIILQ